MTGEWAPSRHVALDGAVNVRDIGGATYLSAAFEEADRRYGSFGRFLTHGLEVGEAMLAELRRALLGGLVPQEPVS